MSLWEIKDLRVKVIGFGATFVAILSSIGCLLTGKIIPGLTLLSLATIFGVLAFNMFTTKIYRENPMVFWCFMGASAINIVAGFMQILAVFKI